MSFSFIVNKLKKDLLDKNFQLVYLLLIISFSLPAIWMHGRVIYFWDGILPFKTPSDLNYLKFSWNQLNGLGYSNAIDKYNIYILSYYFIQIFTGNIAVTQYLLLSLLIALSTVGMYFLLRHLALLLNRKVNNIFPFVGALFYILNYYFIFTFSDFSSTIYMYSLLPLDVLIFSKIIESFNNTKSFFIWTVIFSFLLELTSYSFSLVPMLAFFIFTLVTFSFIFMRHIVKAQLNLTKYVKNSFIFISTILAMNIWWIIGYFINFSSESSSTSISGLSSIVIDFTTNGYYPLKILSTISFYPQLLPIKYANNWFWIIYYYPKYLVFPAIALIFFIVILMPLVFSKNTNSVLSRPIKVRIYIVIFIILFFALQGINPINRYIFYFLENNYPGILVDLYGTRLPFMRMPLLFFYTIVFYDSIYELYNLTLKSRYEIKYKLKKTKSRLLNKKVRAYIIVLILALLLVVYPFYLFTPYAMQSYDTGHGEISESVEFPNYFYAMADYVNTHANNSDTLILPLTYDMLSMNFSHNNSFADDNYAGLLTGSPVIDGQNSTLFNLITEEMNMPNTNFSILLNNINVNYILINTIYGRYVHGYPGNTNVSQIIKYMNDQTSIKYIKNFGPLLLYRNIGYKGTVEVAQTSSSNFTLYSPLNYISALPYFSSINTSFDKSLSGYRNMTFKYTDSGINLTFPFATNKLMNGYYFTNNKTLNVNISLYHYIIITAKSSNGNLYNGTNFAVDTYTYLENGTVASSYIKPLNSATYHQENNLFQTYIYPLYSNPYDDNVGYYNHSIGNDSIDHYIALAVGWHINSTFPSYLNISGIGFARQIDPISSLLYNGNIISPHNSTGAVPKISYVEVNPTLYRVNVHNATGRYAVILRQNYNSLWRITGIPNSETEHFIADYMENGWIVSRTGNYTFYIEFAPQKEYDVINSIALTANIIAVIISTFAIISKRRLLK